MTPQTTAVLLITLSVLVILALFVRSRTREGGHPFEITDKDKADFRKAGHDLRSEFAPRKLVGQLLATLGSLLIACSFYPSDNWRWRTAFAMLVSGVGLTLAGAWLAKAPKPRPPYWRAAVWGVVCSICLLVSFTCVLAIAPIPRERIPDWLRTLLALALVVGLLSAIMCIAHAVTDFVKSRSAGVQASPDPFL